MKEDKNGQSTDYKRICSKCKKKLDKAHATRNQQTL